MAITFHPDTDAAPHRATGAACGSALTVNASVVTITIVRISQERQHRFPFTEKNRQPCLNLTATYFMSTLSRIGARP